jgi:membrane protein YdbS with pleckstrin-like domain
MDDLVKQAIEFYKSGDKEKAEKFLRAALQIDDSNLDAWLWLSGVTKNNLEKIFCLEQVLKINPSNAHAKQGLELLRKQKPKETYRPNPGQSASSSFVSRIKSPGKSQSYTSEQDIKKDYSQGRNKTSEKRIFQVKPSKIPTLIQGGIYISLFILGYLLLSAYYFTSPQNSNNMFAGFTLSLKPLFDISIIVFCCLISIACAIKIIKINFTTYTLTSFRLVIDDGVLTRHHKVIPIDKIQDVAYHQSILERLFNIGDVIVESAGEKSAIHLLDLVKCAARSQEILNLLKDGV